VSIGRKWIIILISGLIIIGCSTAYKSITAAMPDLTLLQDGTYQGIYNLSGAPVKVTLDVTVQDHKITDIKIIKHFCSPIGKKAGKIVDRVIEKQSLEVDVVSGATGSSISILKAIETALQKPPGAEPSRNEDENNTVLRIENGALMGFNSSLSGGQKDKYRNLVISELLTGAITSIGENAFWMEELTGVIIPDGVATIGVRAFAHNHLTRITIPNTVTSIGRSAFAENRLTGVTIPNSVTKIGEWAFYKNQLTSVSIPNSVASIGEYTFHENRLTSVVIPDSVTSIGQSAFTDNHLISVTIGANVRFDGKLPAIDSSFDRLYGSNGKLAGTYTRPDTGSYTWTRTGNRP